MQGDYRKYMKLYSYLMLSGMSLNRLLKIYRWDGGGTAHTNPKKSITNKAKQNYGDAAINATLISNHLKNKLKYDYLCCIIMKFSTRASRDKRLTSTL